MLKVGSRKLFIRNEQGQIKEITPLCVLDFYVHESCQRGGVGKKLFELMLEREHVSPEKLGYDRPSIKLISFLAKHYGLKSYVPQNNNFVVFNQYFDPSIKTSRAISRGED
jgi:alpha-tubulin N-acetyltransferase 1